MSEHRAETDLQGDDQPDADQAAADPTRTGVEDVDAVLESVEGLDDRPVDEHVAVFEDAHERLRRSLDDRPDA